MRFSTVEGFYTISSLPGQPNVAVCTDFTILPKYRGKGAAHRFKAHQNRQLSLLGYTLAICTTQNKNIAQAKVLMKAGWRRNVTFSIREQLAELACGHMTSLLKTKYARNVEVECIP